MCIRDRALLGLGLMLSAGEIPRIAGQFGLETGTKANVMGAVYAAQGAMNPVSYTHLDVYKRQHQGIIRKKKIRDFAQGTGGSTEHPSNDGQGEPVFHHLRSCSGTVLRWGIHCYFVGKFFPCSGDGSGFFISTILVCETDCQSL